MIASELFKWLALVILGAGAIGSLVLVGIVLYWCWGCSNDRSTNDR